MAFDVLGGGDGRGAGNAAVRTAGAAAVPGGEPVASTAGRRPVHVRRGAPVLTGRRLLLLKDGGPPVPVAPAGSGRPERRGVRPGGRGGPGQGAGWKVAKPMLRAAVLAAEFQSASAVVQ